MLPSKVIVHHVERDSGGVIIDLLRKTVGQSREAAHPHTHCEVRTFDIACADVVRVGIANNGLALAADASGGAVALLAFGRVTVDLDQPRVVYGSPEHLLDGQQVRSQAVAGQLDAAR